MRRREGERKGWRNGATKTTKGRNEGGTKGAIQGRERRGRYPEEDTGQYTLHKTSHYTRPLPLTLWYYKWKMLNIYINYVLFDRWVT